MSVPTAPNITADPVIGDGTLTFSWSDADGGASSILSYTLSDVNNPSNSYSAGPSETTYTFPGLTNDTAYVFQIIATNADGDSSPSTYNSATPIAPTVPTAPNITADPTIGDGTLQFSWTAPTSDGGSAILSYTLSDVNDPANTYPLQITDSPFTVSGLTNGTPYTFQILATNAIGDGTIATYNPATPAGSVAPGAPNITIDPITGDGTLQFSWTAPTSDGGSAILSYTLSDVNNPTNTYTLQLTDSPFIVSSLTNETPYTFEILATNAIGPGPAATYNPGTPSANFTAPSVPNITADPTPGDTTLQFSWTAPSSDGGSAITSYTLSDVNNPSTTYTLQLSDSPYTVTGLSNDTPYTFQIIATNAIGSSSAATYNAGTPVGLTVPTAPNITANPVVGSTILTFSWTAPTSDGGSAILYYALSDVNDPANTYTLTLADSPYTVSSLTDGIAYTFQIIAANAIGPGPAATYNAATPLPVPPTAPNITADPIASDGILTFSWTAPNSEGTTPVTSYTLSDVNNPSNSIVLDITDSPYGFAGLTNGTAYTFQIVATSSIGDGPPATYNSATPATTPSAPNITADPVVGSGALTFSWTAPDSDGGDEIINYTLSDVNNPSTSLNLLLSQSPFQFVGLTNGTAYTFQIIANNSIGLGAAATYNSASPASGPSQPIITIDPTPDDESLTFSWTAPTDDGGSAILNYILVDINNPSTTFNIQLSESPYTVSGLTNGTTYTFQIYAVNSNADGTVATYNPATPATTPSAPGITADPTPSNGTLAFTWTVPTTDGGAAIQYYTLSDVNNPSNTYNLQLYQSPYTVSGLTNGAAYTFQILAVNAIGSGTISTYNSGTPIVVPPSAPNITINPTSENTELTFSWTAPSDNGGSAIISYILSDVNDPSDTYTLDLSDSPYTVSGLINGTLYTYQILATNSAGSGAVATYNATSPSGVPSAPNITITPVSNSGSITLSWTAPTSDGGSAILSYIITCIAASISIPGLSLGNSPYTVTGLTNGTSYIFKIAAINSSGTGPQATYNSSIPAGRPSPPLLIGSNIRPVATNQTLEIWWNTPLSDGGNPILSYVYYLNRNYSVPYDIGLPVSNSYTINSLTNGTEYIVELGAVNVGGVGDLTRYRSVEPGFTPGIPSAISLTSLSSIAIRVNWSAPVDDGGANIKWYVITPISSDPNDPYTSYNSSASLVDASYGHYGKKSANGTDRSVVFNGLTIGNTYRFGVCAVNDPGYSPMLVSP